MNVSPELRALASELPRCSGVYTFLGDEDAPLYIGKSVNIRGRVLDHLRNPDESRLIKMTRRFEFTRTAREIGALLLEAQQVKMRQPLFNRRLRRNRRLCTIALIDGRPRAVNVHDAGAAPTFGLFASQHAVTEALRKMADDHLLCYGELGLERLQPGRSCFRYALKRCAGACVGAESPEEHRDRRRSALLGQHVQAWPYEGAVGIVEKSAEMREIHVVRNWSYLGTAKTIPQARKLDRPAANFDRDGYRILVGPLLSRKVELLDL